MSRLRIGSVVLLLAAMSCATRNDRYLRTARASFEASDHLQAIANAVEVEGTEPDPVKREEATRLIEAASLALAQRSSARDELRFPAPLPGFSRFPVAGEAEQLALAPWCREACQQTVKVNLARLRLAELERYEASATSATRAPIERFISAREGLLFCLRHKRTDGFDPIEQRLKVAFSKAFVDELADAERVAAGRARPAMYLWSRLAKIPPDALLTTQRPAHERRVAALAQDAARELERFGDDQPALQALARLLAGALTGQGVGKPPALLSETPVEVRSDCPAIGVDAASARVPVPSGARLMVHVGACKYEGHFKLDTVMQQVSNPGYLKASPGATSTHREYVGGKYDSSTGTTTGIGSTRSVTTWTPGSTDRRRTVTAYEEVLKSTLKAIAPIRIELVVAGRNATEQRTVDGEASRSVPMKHSGGLSKLLVEANAPRSRKETKVTPMPADYARQHGLVGVLFDPANEALTQATRKLVRDEAARTTGALLRAVARQAAETNAPNAAELAAWMALWGTLDPAPSRVLYAALGLDGTDARLLDLLAGKSRAVRFGRTFPPPEKNLPRLPVPATERPDTSR